MNKLKFIIAWFLFLLIPATSFSQPSGIKLPNSENIASITITRNDQSTHSISDREIIDKTFTILKNNNVGWNASANTFPTPSASASFSTAEKSPVLMLWFGTNWIGARAEMNGKTQNLLWQIPSSVESDFRKLLSIQP